MRVFIEMSALTRLFLFWAKKHSHPDGVLPVKKDQAADCEMGVPATWLGRDEKL